jgi:hypothetical protein
MVDGAVGVAIRNLRARHIARRGRDHLCQQKFQKVSVTRCSALVVVSPQRGHHRFVDVT